MPRATLATPTRAPLKRGIGDCLGRTPHARAGPGVLSAPCHTTTSDSTVPLLWWEEVREGSVVWEGIGRPSNGEGSLLGCEFLSLVRPALDGVVGFFVYLHAVHVSAFGAHLDDLHFVAADDGRRAHGPDQRTPERPHSPAALSPRSLAAGCARSSGPAPEASEASAKRQRVAVAGNCSASDSVAKATTGRTR